MNISIEAIELIKKFESFSSEPYICPAGYKTIGYGHVIKYNENYNHLSKFEAENLLMQDLAKYCKFINNNIIVYLNPNQFGAIASFTYNVGSAAFFRSTIRMKINSNIFSDLDLEFKRWNRARGKILPGLIKRREAEIELFFT